VNAQSTVNSGETATAATQANQSTEAHLWFGPEDRPLFATASVPAGGRAIGAVVLCQALGVEAVSARRTFSTLGRALASAGILAVRFDYDGTGDSAGSDEDPGRVAAWLAGVHQAVELAHRSGATRVGVLGMRLGATLAAAALAEANNAGAVIPDALVLWDPCLSGRTFLRAQKALHAFRYDRNAQDDGSVEAPGVVFGAETVAGLNTLDLGSLDGGLARRLLVLAREAQPGGTGALERFVAAQRAERWVAHGQEHLVDVKPDAAQVPEADLEAVTAWLRDALGGERVPVSVPGRNQILVREAGGDAGPVVERVVALGPHELFGIVAEPVTETAGGSVGPTAIFLNAGLIDHAGPARMWVDLARRWAGNGLRSVRCDLSGLGNSQARAGRPVDETHAPEALDDVLEICTAASSHDPSAVVLVGLCSGGYHAIEGALALKARGVSAINPVLAHKPAEVRAEENMDARRQAAPIRKRWVRALPAHDQLGALVDRMPDPVWWLLNRVAVEQSPAEALCKLVELGVRTFIVSGERERWMMWRGERRAYRAIGRSGQYRHVVSEDIDHELFQRHARDLVSEILTDDMLDTYVPGWRKTGHVASHAESTSS
jgi:dienelactone hydrolase